MPNESPRPIRRWLDLLAERLARHRLNRDLSQAELAAQAGISVRTLSRLENGEATQLENFLRVLLALGLEPGLEALVPDVPKSPLQQLERDGRTRQRASGSRTTRPAAAPEWTWGDEE